MKKNFAIYLLILVLTIVSVINITYSHGIISQFLVNNPIYPGRSIQPESPNDASIKTNKNNAYFHIDENVILQTNDLLTCKVLKGNDANNGAEFKVNTPPLAGNTIFYTYLPVPHGETCFSIKVRAEKYAYLALSENPYKGGRLYDIILGITGPMMQSSLRKNLIEEVVKVPTPGIINGKEFREFIISWNEGAIMVLRGSDFKQFLYYHEPNMYPVNYIGIATYDKPGTWIVNNKSCSDIKKPVNSENLVTECWIQRKHDKNSQFDSLVQLQKYLMVQMTNDYGQFNKSQQNDKEIMEFYKQELKDTYNKVKEVHNEIILSKIKSDNKDQLNNYNEAEKNYEEIRKLFLEYYGNLSNLLNNLNTSNDMSENLDTKCNGIVKKPNHENMKLISASDEFYEITSNGCFKLQVQRSVGSVRVTLTNGRKKSLKALIIIDKVSEIQTWKDLKNIENNKISTPIVENRGEYQTYWFSWNAQRISVGLGGEVEFMSTNKPIDFTDLKYVNIATENEGLWEMEDAQCPHDIDIRIDE